LAKRGKEKVQVGLKALIFSSGSPSLAFKIPEFFFFWYCLFDQILGFEKVNFLPNWELGIFLPTLFMEIFVSFPA